MSYQVGVFISRSSLNLFKIRKIWIMTVLQTINFVIYYTIAEYRWMSIYYQIPFITFVGLMGGASYVNCFYLIYKEKRLSKSQKEIAVNLAVFFDNLGIVMAAILAIIVSNYVIVDSE